MPANKLDKIIFNDVIEKYRVMVENSYYLPSEERPAANKEIRKMTKEIIRLYKANLSLYKSMSAPVKWMSDIIVKIMSQPSKARDNPDLQKIKQMVKRIDNQLNDLSDALLNDMANEVLLLAKAKKKKAL